MDDRRHGVLPGACSLDLCFSGCDGYFAAGAIQQHAIAGPHALGDVAEADDRRNTHGASQDGGVRGVTTRIGSEAQHHVPP